MDFLGNLKVNIGKLDSNAYIVKFFKFEIWPWPFSDFEWQIFRKMLHTKVFSIKDRFQEFVLYICR